MRSQELQQALEKLKATSADIEAAALVSQEGFIIASVLSENLDEERHMSEPKKQRLQKK